MANLSIQTIPQVETITCDSKIPQEKATSFWDIFNPYWYFSETTETVQPIQKQVFPVFEFETFELNDFGVEVTNQNTNTTRVMKETYYSNLLEFWKGKDNDENNIDIQYKKDVHRFVTIKLGNETYDTTYGNRHEKVDKFIDRFKYFQMTGIKLSACDFLKLLFSQTILINILNTLKKDYPESKYHVLNGTDSSIEVFNVANTFTAIVKRDFRICDENLNFLETINTFTTIKFCIDSDKCTFIDFLSQY